MTALYRGGGSSRDTGRGAVRGAERLGGHRGHLGACGVCGEGGGGPDTCKRGPPRPAPPATLRSGDTRRDEHRGRGSPPRRVRAPHLQAGSPPGNWNQTPLTRPVLRERDSREHRTGPPQHMRDPTIHPRDLHVSEVGHASGSRHPRHRTTPPSPTPGNRTPTHPPGWLRTPFPGAGMGGRLAGCSPLPLLRPQLPLPAPPARSALYRGGGGTPNTHLAT